MVLKTTMAYKKSSVLLLVALLAACGGDDSNKKTDKKMDDSDSANAVKSLSVNASSRTSWAYVDLDTKKVLELSDEQALKSDVWDIKMQRTSVYANSGGSNKGSVSVALADAQDEFYNNGKAVKEKFVNATADAYEDDLKRTYTNLEFKTDSLAPAIKNWYNYSTESHTISANTEQAYIIVHASGKAYSKLKITKASSAGLSLSYNLQIQGQDTFSTTASTLDANIEEGKTNVCVDLDAKTVVDCASNDWDLNYEYNKAKRKINLWTNGGVKGSGKGKAFTTKASSLSKIDSATNGGQHSYSSYAKADGAVSVFSKNKWYQYNVNGNHKISPNFRTYIVNTGKKKYALQIVSYESLGETGTPSIHFVEHE